MRLPHCEAKPGRPLGNTDHLTTTFAQKTPEASTVLPAPNADIAGKPRHATVRSIAAERGVDLADRHETPQLGAAGDTDDRVAADHEAGVDELEGVNAIAHVS
jgi:pyruvate/2-oxoglutarate dehydrogenase complex dihydrolipoamide acyltransferase (E2) component